MKWFLTGAVLIALGTFIYFAMMFTGPHMEVQPKIHAYERSMPLPPKGIVPVEPDEKTVPSPDQAMRMRNPVPDTQRNRDRGRIYYRYYCAFCHGRNGQGDGPVGYGYMPAPTDLHHENVRKKSDGELLRSMLTGIGHEPVLSRVVLPGHRWYLVTYIRTIGKTPRIPSENQGEQVIVRTPETR